MNRLNGVSFRAKVVGAVAVMLLITVALTSFSFLTAREDERATDQVEQTMVVTNDIQRMWSALLGVSSSYRGYMLTGQTQYQLSYESGFEQYESHLSQVRELTVDNPTQQARWLILDNLVANARQNVLEPGVALRQEVNAGSASLAEISAYIGTNRGQTQLVEVKGIIDDAIALEDALLVQREEIERSHHQRLELLLVGGTGIVLLVGLMITFWINREVLGVLNRLAMVSRSIEAGDFSQRIGIERQDEIGRTATAFDRMAARLGATVSDLNDAVQRFRTSEERTRTVLDNVAEGILTFDETGVIDALNPAAERMFGYEHDALVGRNVVELLIHESVVGDGFLSNGTFELQLGDTAGASHSLTGLRKDGSEFPLEVKLSDLHHDGSRRIIAIARDVTEQREAQQRLKRQFLEAERARTETSAVINATGDGMVLISPDHQVVSMNWRFSELFAISPGDLLGRPATEFLAQLNRALEEPARFETLLNEMIDDGELEVRDTFAQHWPARRELELFSTAVTTAGRDQLGRLFAFRDITHQREVDRMKTEFVSLVSHELRTPLTSIKGYVDLLLDGEAGTLQAEQCEFLEIVGNNVQRLVGLINDLLDISRIESGKADLSLAPVDLGSVFDRLSTSFRPQFEQKQHRVSFELPANLPPVLADPGRLTQILTNLISNAHKYTSSGGQIRVAASAADDQVRIDVEDTGIGLTADEQERLFAKFYRARNRTTEEVGGTGLGLAITRSLVEMHGGTITVSSEPSRGSTFSFALSIAEQEAVPPVEPDVRPSQATILIVEDERDIAHLIRHHLERAGHHALLARTAAEAIEIAHRERLDLITLDLKLPDADGFAALEWLKEDFATCGIPVIILSMLPDDGIGRALGAVDYLVKPVELDTLVARVNRVLTPAGESATVLIADDEEDVRRLLGDQLRRAGHEVIEAADGEEVLLAVAAREVDVILLDVRMPGMDGIATLRALRERERTRCCPVIMMTACPTSFDDEALTLDRLGVSELLHKPLSPEELARSIGSVMGRTSEAATR